MSANSPLFSDYTFSELIVIKWNGTVVIPHFDCVRSKTSTSKTDQSLIKLAKKGLEHV